MFAICALFGGYRWLQVLNVRSDATEQTQEANAAAAQYARITSTFPRIARLRCTLRLVAPSRACATSSDSTIMSA